MWFVDLHENEVVILDKTLERIISLIPKKENGDFKHGALKEFANSIGLKSGNLISDWIAGRSVPYNSYVYEIAAKYNVSVEWLNGETDEKGIKNQPADASSADELTDTQKTAIDMIKSMSDSDLEMYLEILKTIKKKKAD